MLGRKARERLELFVTGSLDQLVPEDHVLARVDRVLDLGWLREEVADCYSGDNGRPGIDPEVAVRLMLAGLLLGIVHDRRLMREAQVNIAIRWFIGYGLHERLPDHSSLTRIRQRWGEARFRRVFQRTVAACLDAKIATAEVVHVDATLIRADASWESLVERHAGDVMAANAGDREIEAGSKRRRARGQSRKVSLTDPDASMATSGRLTARARGALVFQRLGLARRDDPGNPFDAHPGPPPESRSASGNALGRPSTIRAVSAER